MKYEELPEELKENARNLVLESLLVLQADILYHGGNIVVCHDLFEGMIRMERFEIVNGQVVKA